MKTILSKNDKLCIARGLRQGVFFVSQLNHLTKNIADHSGDTELFGDVTVELTANDKRALLGALKSGSIDFTLLPDLTEKIEQNYFLTVMQNCD